MREIKPAHAKSASLPRPHLSHFISPWQPFPSQLLVHAHAEASPLLLQERPCAFQGSLETSTSKPQGTLPTLGELFPTYIQIQWNRAQKESTFVLFPNDLSFFFFFKGGVFLLGCSFLWASFWGRRPAHFLSLGPCSGRFSTLFILTFTPILSSFLFFC